MDNFLINMTLATCAGWIMDNLPIIMTLGTPTPTWDARGPPREMGKAYSSHSIGNIAQLRLTLIHMCGRKWVKYSLIPISSN